MFLIVEIVETVGFQILRRPRAVWGVELGASHVYVVVATALSEFDVPNPHFSQKSIDRRVLVV
jgi:hypothetical protein